MWHAFSAYFDRGVLPLIVIMKFVCNKNMIRTCVGIGKYRESLYPTLIETDSARNLDLQLVLVILQITVRWHRILVLVAEYQHHIHRVVDERGCRTGWSDGIGHRRGEWGRRDGWDGTCGRD